MSRQQPTRWLMLILGVMTTVSLAGSGQFINPITDVCWDCLFPMSLGGHPIYNGQFPDTPNPSMPLCFCPGDPVPRVGLSVGYWEPMALVDVTREPFRLVTLGGTQLAIGAYYGRGQVTNHNSDAQPHSFYYVHWYRFPLLYWLNLLTDGLCVEKGDFDLGYLTELDPTWRDDALNSLVNPEAALLGNPVAQTACAADSLAAMAGLPLDWLFWCMGAQGSAYPLTGQVQNHQGGVQASTLLAERMVYKLHRLGMIWDSTSNLGLCMMHPTPILPKSRYRYQMVYPVATTTPRHGCHAFGQTTSLWGAGHEFPYKGEDFGYLIWRKRNCCAF